MALPEPPKNIPRIVEVLDPGAGSLRVIIRMPAERASKFPNKAWLTPITEIGLSKQDSDRYEDYVLVDFEAVKGTSDLYWIFERLSGPTWTTRSNSRENLVPPKFRESVLITKTKQDVVPDTALTALTGDVVSSTVEEQDKTGKALKVNVSEAITENVTPLLGEQTGTWGVEGTSEQLVTEGSPTPYGFLTKKSSVSPLGNGKSVEQVETYPAVEAVDVIYTLFEEETDQNTLIPVYMKKSLVNASAASALAAVQRAAGWITEIRALDKWHSILICSKLDESILALTQAWQETKEISMPDILKVAAVIWDSDIVPDAGNTGTEHDADIVDLELGWQVSAEANITGSVQGRPYTEVAKGYRGPAIVSVERTFVYGPPSTLDPLLQPHVFGEVYGTITVHGVQSTVSSNAEKSGRGDISVSFSSKSRRHLDNNMLIHNFGPVIHNGVVLTDLGDSPTVSQLLSSSGGGTPSGGFYPTASADLSITGSAELKLPASNTPLVTGNTYLLDVRINPYRLGYWVIEKYTAIVP